MSQRKKKTKWKVKKEKKKERKKDKSEHKGRKKEKKWRKKEKERIKKEKDKKVWFLAYTIIIKETKIINLRFPFILRNNMVLLCNKLNLWGQKIWLAA